jgi:membrane protein
VAGVAARGGVGAAAERVAQAARRGATLVQRSVAEFFDDGCPQRAAAISYYALFSLFPLAIVLVAVFGLVVNDEHARGRVIEFLLDELPLQQDEGKRKLETLLRSVTADVRGFGVMGLLGLVFAASGVMGAIRHGLNAAWETADARPPLQGKLVDVLLVLGLGLAILGSFALSIAMRVVPLGALAPVAAQVVTLLIDAAIVTVLFRLVPAPRTGLRDTWPGIVLAAVGLELTKAGFALYLTTFARYSAIYASLGSIIALLVFTFVAANVFLLGAEAASEWPGVRDGENVDEGPDVSLRRQAWEWLRSLAVRRDDPRSPREPVGPGAADPMRTKEGDDGRVARSPGARNDEGPGDEPGPSRAT